MTAPEESPLPPETKVAVGALGLLFLQSLREFFLFTFGSQNDLASRLSPLFLVVLFALIKGLLDRNDLAWWSSVVLIGSVAARYLSTTLLAMRDSWRVLGPWSNTVPSYQDLLRLESLGMVSRFELFGVIARNVLLLTVPVVLLLGALRERIRRRQPVTNGFSARS